MKVIYVFLIKLVSLLFYFRKKSNVIYIMSFDNNLGLIKSMARQMPKNKNLYVYYEPANEAAATDLAAYGIKTVPFKNGLKLVFDLIPKIMASNIVFCDNYFPFLGGIFHPKELKIVQLWHANGAIKKFGWQDASTDKRSVFDKKRFQKVYDSFDEYVVASETMGNVFKNSYHVPFDRMKMIGYPRSDRLFKEKWIKIAKRRVYNFAPQLKNKRVILYAPTYRDDGKSFVPPKGLIESLTVDKNAIVVIKLHPLLRDLEAKLQKESTSDNVIFCNQLSTTDLLVVTDTLITDYSSVAFDYSLLPNAHSLLFFMFDLDEYKQNPGIQNDLLNWLPTKPITSLEDLQTAIKKDEAVDFSNFNHHWNKYNDGFATSRVIDRYIKTLK
ncbi:CDP-glycerol glycerophosphotransferase family protein [Apilactobacillus bombintestini]|uniref:CDP-glycerol glycerophosphotransferase family protein n=1 Tax=Apilactobacillus bombintestini TaxID=2419772 RepID=A0A387APA6_9LACO|nr:CDP-glycerol glycerophosphotransferase family protein [Apilactobacillus bombintestini]